jgi:UDP-N-acetylglucosamine:LPS N-acetylglucosamine transferase
MEARVSDSETKAKTAKSPLRVLAISSSGGHWEQLMLLRDGYAAQDVHYAATMAGLAERSGVGTAIIVPDFNAQRPFKTLSSLFAIAKVVFAVKPHVVISTGAAPGLVALFFARLSGARTIWIDSVANSERLSMSGRMAGRFCHVWLTQWQHLATPKGPFYRGTVL